MQEKERTICRLRNDNQELESYKAILEFSVEQMEREILPKDLEILEVKKTIQFENERLGAISAEQNKLRAQLLLQERTY